MEREFAGDFAVSNIIDNHMAQAVSWARLYGSRYIKSKEAKGVLSKLPSDAKRKQVEYPQSRK